MESFIQENQSSDIHSVMTYNQDSYSNSANNNHNSNNNNNNANNGGANGGNNSGSGGGGNTISYVNAIPIPEEFVSLGIKPGLLGGSPAWNEKKETAENKNSVEKTEKGIEEVENLKPSTSSKSATSTVTSQFYGMDDDVDSRDANVFASLPSKLCVKPKSPSSPSDFEVAEFQSCITPKTSEDSIELPLYKDVTLDSCKSEENSLGIGDFASTMEDSEMPVPSLVIESGSLHLIDSSDVRGDDFGDCLVSPNLLVLNVSEEHDGIMDDTGEIGPIFYFDKMDDDLNKNEGVIITDITDMKNEEIEEKPETSVTEEAGEPDREIKEEVQTDSENEAPRVENELEATPEEKPKENDVAVAVAPSENSVREAVDDRSADTRPANASVAASLPIRTTSVLQMTPSLLHSSTSKEANVTYSNIQLPVYIENFHSYVKKFPKTTTESVTVKEELNIDKDKQLFDETLMKIKKENMNETVEEVSKQDSNSTVERHKNGDGGTATPTVTSTVLLGAPNSVITKETKTALAAAVSQIKKENGPAMPTPQAVVTTSVMLPPRVRVNDDSQNVLLKQLLQNSSAANITHSTMTQHVTKPSPSPSPTYRSPPLTTTADAILPTVSQTLTDAIIAQVSEPAPMKTEVSSGFSDAFL